MFAATTLWLWPLREQNHLYCLSSFFFLAIFWLPSIQNLLKKFNQFKLCRGNKCKVHVLEITGISLGAQTHLWKWCIWVKCPLPDSIVLCTNLYIFQSCSLFLGLMCHLPCTHLLTITHLWLAEGAAVLTVCDREPFLWLRFNGLLPHLDSAAAKNRN